MEKENPNLITVFICFLRSGLRFNRYDTNNIGLAFIEEIKKHNPNFKPVKVQQRERDQIYTVNAYPKEFEPLILSLIEEYRLKNKLEYRLKKPRGGGRGGYNRGGGSRQGGYNQGRDQGYSQRRTGDSSREGGYRPRRNYNSGEGQEGYRPRPNRDDNRRYGESGNRPRREGGINRDDGNRNYNRDDNSSNRYSNDRNSNPERRRPPRPRRDVND